MLCGFNPHTSNMNSTTKTLITAAINLNLIDTAGLIEMVATHDDNAALLAELDDIADANRHSMPGVRAAWIGVVDAVNFRTRDDLGIDADDKHGFRAAARKTANAALVVAGIECAACSYEYDGGGACGCTN